LLVIRCDALLARCFAEKADAAVPKDQVS